MIERAAVRFNPDDYYEMAVDKDAVTCDVHGFMNGEPIDFSGGGGSDSNFISGSFKFNTETSEAFDVEIPYEGEGFPVAVIVSVSDGVFTQDTAQLAKNSILYYALVKDTNDNPPSYSGYGHENASSAWLIYKSNGPSTGVNSYATGGVGSTRYTLDNPNSDSPNQLCIRNNTTLRILVKADTSTGFASNTNYNYMVQYSE